MRVINTGDLQQDTPLSRNERDWVYNGLDCCVTLEIRDVLRPQFDNISANTYAFSQALQAPILEMAMRGLRVNQKRRSEVLSRYSAQIFQLSEQLTAIVRDGIGFPVENRLEHGKWKMWWRSPAQLKTLLYDVMGLPVQRKRNAQGLMAPSTNRDAVEKLSAYFIAEPICAHLLALRDLDKKRQFLETEIDPDGRMRSSFNIAGTNTGRLASSMSDFGSGCVRPTAQALTPTGWRNLGELQDGDLIAQFDNGIVEFVPADFYRTQFKGKLLQYKTEQVELAVTPEHRVLSANYNRPLETTAAMAVFGARQRYIPLSGIKEGQLEIPAYVAMLMADCSKDGTVWRTQLKKPRKIERLLRLCNEGNIPVVETKAREGYRRFTIYADITLPKKWGAWVLMLSASSAKELVEEAAYWDAHIRGKSFIFYSADREQAEWFQTLCHLAGKSATLRSTQNSEKAYGKQSIIYSVNVKPKREAQVLTKHWSTVDYEGEVCCPQVLSSYWLVRENGFISVTGNTNLQNVDRDLRSVFIADPGMKFANLDLEQADSRNLGALCWENFYESHGEAFAGAYLNLCESGDLHTRVSQMARPHLPWTDDQKANRKIADTIYYRNYSYRDLDKRLGHGSNYLGTPRTMAKHAKVPVHEVETFQHNYFRALPCIPAYHAYVQHELAEYAQLTTLFNRRRFFFGRKNDAATLREAVAYSPQSMTADEINTGMLNLWRADRIQLLVQVHDSILFQYPEHLEDVIIPWALKNLRVPLTLKGGREFVVPTEAKIGWNWGDVVYNKDGSVKDNPDGLIKWKGGDSRKRTDLDWKLSVR